jgi:hypothetical protein
MDVIHEAGNYQMWIINKEIIQNKLGFPKLEVLRGIQNRLRSHMPEGREPYITL